MEIKDYYGFDDLENKCWSGAEDTLATIREHDMEDEFMDWIESYFGDEIPTLTEVNDLLRFDGDWVFEQIGLDPDEEDEDDDEYWDDDEDEDDSESEFEKVYVALSDL